MLITAEDLNCQSVDQGGGVVGGGSMKPPGMHKKKSYWKLALPAAKGRAL